MPDTPRPLTDAEAAALAGAMIAQTRAAWRCARGPRPPRVSAPRSGGHPGSSAMPAPLVACPELAFVVLLMVVTLGGMAVDRLG